jgi:hypothetical protein
VFNASKSSGPTYRVFAYQSFIDGQGTTLDATVVGQSVTITLRVAQAGIYDVKFATKAHNTRGIVQLTVKGAKVEPAADEYSANDVGDNSIWATYRFLQATLLLFLRR